MATTDTQVVLDFFDNVLNKGNLDAVDQYIATNFTNHNVASPTGSGPASVRQLLLEARKIATSFAMRVDDVVSEGDRVVVRSTAVLKLIDGQGVEQSGIDIFRIAAGKIVESWGARANT